MSIFIMTKNRFSLSRQLILLTSIFFFYACAPQTTPTLFRPPTSIPPTQPLSTTTPIPALFTPAPTFTLTPTATPGPCINDLDFIDDVTVDDGTSFLPGAAIDKQWLVQNSGTCGWDDTYRLKWVGGYPLGAGEEQLIYPARAGTQATLRILFIAPAEPGSYVTSWQAVDADGNVFGDPIFMQVVVTP